MKNDKVNKTLSFKTGKDILNLLSSKEEQTSTSDFSPPSNETESILFEIWKTVLINHEFGVNDDFFKIGGNSVKAVQLISRISRQFPVNINLTDIFLQPTIKQLADYIQLPKTDFSSIAHIENTERPQHIPLSFSQERLWFIHQLDEDSVQYHLPYVLRLKGNLQYAAADYALQTFVNRHEILRTVIRSDHNGVGYQYIKDKNSFALSRVNGTQYLHHPEELNQYIDSLVRKPFDLSNDHLFRVKLIELSEQESILVATLHHIASDGWSKSIFVKELVQLYNAFKNGNTIELTPLQVQYADYAIWQQKYYRGEWFDNKLSYWKGKLKNVSPLELPTDHPLPPIQSTNGAKIDFRIDEQLSNRLQKLSQQHGVTLFMTLFSAFKVLLHRYSNQDDICVGTPIANRTVKETEELVGFFVNTLVIRSEVNSDQTFIKFLQEFKATALEAYEQQDVPFEKVVEAVVKERDPGRNPLFQVMFILQNVPQLSHTTLEGLEVSREPYESSRSQFDLTFNIREIADGLNGEVEYCTDLFNSQTIQRMIKHYKELLNSIVEQPGQKIGLLPMLTAEEEHQLLVEFNNTKSEYPKHKTIVDLFEEQVAKTPEAIAIVFEERKLTYKELNEKANQLAHYLISRGVKSEMLVPVCIERSIEMIVGILGILKAGGAYVPFDPEYPEERIRYMLEDTAASIVIGNQKSKIKLPVLTKLNVIELDTNSILISNCSIKNIQNNLQQHHLAYVIYTSGSTGNPKGVMIEHCNAYSFIHWCMQEFSKSIFEIVYASTSICFDLSIFEIFYPLSIGKCLRILENGLAISKYLNVDEKVLINTVPSVIQSLLNDHTDLRNVSVLNMAGEPIPSKVQQMLDADIIETRNLYGPTESTTYSTICRLGNEKPATIGRPIGNTHISILNNEMQLVPVGVKGEIYIGGAGVARGYLNRDKLTHERFIHNSFGERLYRTGDIGKWLADGNIDYQGRLDDQVKIRGYRIELGEIETILLTCEGIKQGVVLARKDKGDDKRLVAYVITNEMFNRDSVVSVLKSKLPEYMIPLAWVELKNFPLTANGKIDKKAFPDPDASELISNTYIAPRNETEEKIAAIWKELLSIEKAGVHDNFFELGGHSLLATRVISAVRKQLNAELTIKDLFVFTTIAQLANHLSNDLNRKLHTIQVHQRPEFIPLSFTQERLWFIDQLGGSIQYQSTAVWRLISEVNKDALSNALQQLVNRHEALHTVIIEHDGIPYQSIKDSKDWELEIIDGTSIKDISELKNYVGQLMRKPFDLSKDFPVRAFLIKISNEFALVITTHHIASDGWSRSIFLKELSAIYKAIVLKELPALSPLPVQYADYVIWQRTHQPEILDKKIEYWVNKLNGVAALQLPTDFQRPPVFSTRGAVKFFDIEKSLSDDLKKFSQQHNATLFMTLLSAFKVMLYKYSGQQDICVGFPIANRTQQEVEGLIGFFANTLALRSNVNGEDAFIDLLQQVRSSTLEAYEYQEAPFEKIVSIVVKERDMSRNPIFQVMFVIQNTPEIPQLELEGVQVIKEDFKRTASIFDLTFNILETPNGFNVALEYCTDLFKEDTIMRMAEHFKVLLLSIVNDPLQKIDLLSMLTTAEENKLLHEFNNTLVVYPKEKSIIDLFEEQVVKTPDAVAVVFNNEQLSYKELNAKANQLAHYLRDKGVKEETLVPIYIDRGLEMMVGLLGILKAGGGYVPVDPNYPFERIQYMLIDTQAMLIVTNKKGSKTLPVLDNVEIIKIDDDNENISDKSTNDLKIIIKPFNLAYVIYTSGSTGKPKGVMIEHSSVVNLLLSIADKVNFTSGNIFLSVTTYSFDICYLELYMPLIKGGKLIIVPREIASDGYSLSQSISHYHPSHMQGTPSTWQLLLDAEWENKEEIKMLIGGEAVKEDIKNALTDIGFVWNVYGPTETTIWSAINQLKKEEKVCIGTPIANTEVYILNTKEQLVPIGIIGEICIGGAGLARGYVNLQELTSQKFINNPFDSKGNSRLYKTGDLGRWLPDGKIECLGRTDDQVKIRGYRIELKEIETVLLQSGLIKQVVVIVKGDKQQNKRLVGYVIVEDIFDKQAVTGYLYHRLPDYMIPSLWVELESFPLTPNGKIDKRVFPEPNIEVYQLDQFVPPQTDIEKSLTNNWQQLLNQPKIGIHDNFFELGGHSLLLMRMGSYIKKTFSIMVPIHILFQFTTINELGKYIEVELKKGDAQPGDNVKYKIINI